MAQSSISIADMMTEASSVSRMCYERFLHSLSYEMMSS